MDSFSLGYWLKSHGPPGEHTPSAPGGSVMRIRLGTLAATIFAFVLASLIVIFAGGFGAKSANAQTAATISPLAWGWNAFGQLGDGTNNDSYTPVQVSGLTDVKAIEAGWYHSAAVKNDGTASAWGWNANGQLGNGTTTDSNTPVQVSGLSGITKISAGDRHTVALASKAPDTTKPSITLSTPANNTAYKLKSTVLADFSCQDELGGSGIKSCVGTVDNGSPIDTKTVGIKTFTVTAVDNAGNENSVKHTYGVNGGGKTPPPLTK